MAESDSEPRAIATNRRARYEYEILDTWEAGIALLGAEVKSLRTGKANLSDSYATVRRGEAFLVNVHISPYDKAGRDNPEPRRERKLLLHRREIARIRSSVAEKGLTLVPLKLYFKNGRAKVELGLARGKRRYDKRETIRRRDHEREMQRAVRGRRRT
ncbi:MAG: SsrA-binding protein SmpB [Planctomycetes bacterium]|nr:SsrA-binding protein SmpB [Planctomycetota bacterium]